MAICSWLQVMVTWKSPSLGVTDRWPKSFLSDGDLEVTITWSSDDHLFQVMNRWPEPIAQSKDDIPKRKSNSIIHATFLVIQLDIVLAHFTEFLSDLYMVYLCWSHVRVTDFHSHLYYWLYNFMIQKCSYKGNDKVSNGSLLPIHDSDINLSFLYWIFYLNLQKQEFKSFNRHHVAFHNQFHFYFRRDFHQKTFLCMKGYLNIFDITMGLTRERRLLYCVGLWNSDVNGLLRLLLLTT